RLPDEPRRKAAWRVIPTAIVQRFLYPLDIACAIAVERRNGQMALRLLRLLLIGGDPSVPDHRDDRRLLLIFQLIFLMAHHGRACRCPRTSREYGAAEIQHTIPRHDEQLVLQVQPLHGELDTLHRTQPRFVRACTVVQTRDGIRAALSLALPLLK